MESKAEAPTTVSELMLADPASTANNTAAPAYSTKVVPVQAWLEGEHTNKEIVEPLSPALWAAEQQRLKRIKLLLQAQHAQLSLEMQRAHGLEDDAEGGAGFVMDGAGAAPAQEEFSVPSARGILMHDREAVRQFLDGELCVSDELRAS